MKRKKKRSKGQERKSQDMPEIKPHLIQSPFFNGLCTFTNEYCPVWGFVCLVPF